MADGPGTQAPVDLNNLGVQSYGQIPGVVPVDQQDPSQGPKLGFPNESRTRDQDAALAANPQAKADEAEQN
jgi:hypothetical protein